MLGKDVRQTKIKLAYLRPTDIFSQKKMERSNLRCKMQDLYPVPMATFYRALQICCILISTQYNDCVPLFFFFPSIVKSTLFS